jgi:hypothetical protein
MLTVGAMLKSRETVDRIDLTDRHPDAVTAIHGLVASSPSRSLLVASSSPPAGSAPTKRAGWPLTVSSERERAVSKRNGPVGPRCAVAAATRTPASWLCSGERCSSEPSSSYSASRWDQEG